MAEKGDRDSSDEEPTIADDVVVTKYKMAGEIANRESYHESVSQSVRVVVFVIDRWISCVV